MNDPHCFSRLIAPFKLPVPVLMPPHPKAPPCLDSQIVEEYGQPVAVVLVFDPNHHKPLIAEGETVAYRDRQGRLMELRTTRALQADSLVASAKQQRKWICCSCPVEVVRWKREKS